MLGLGLRGTEANAIRAEEVLMAAVQGGDHVLIDATERAYRRSQEDVKQREHSSGKKTAYAQEHGYLPPREVHHLSRADV